MLEGGLPGVVDIDGAGVDIVVAVEFAKDSSFDWVAGALVVGWVVGLSESEVVAAYVAVAETVAEAMGSVMILEDPVFSDVVGLKKYVFSTFQ